MIKKLSKYIATFNHIDKSLIVLYAASGGMSIIFFISIISATAGIASVTFTLAFSLIRGIIKKVLKIKRNKMKKHNNIVMLANGKLNSIETVLSQALIDLEISHSEFKTIIKKKEKHEKIKESIKMVKSKKTIGVSQKIEKMHKIKKIIFLTRIKCLNLVLTNLLILKFTQ